MRYASTTSTANSIKSPFSLYSAHNSGWMNSSLSNQWLTIKTIYDPTPTSLKIPTSAVRSSFVNSNLTSSGNPLSYNVEYSTPGNIFNIYKLGFRDIYAGRQGGASIGNLSYVKDGFLCWTCSQRTDIMGWHFGYPEYVCGTEYDDMWKGYGGNIIPVKE